MIKEIQWVNVDKIQPYEKNARKNQDAIPKVAESIKNFGFVSPIICNVDGVILAGHTRLAAAKSLNLTEVPVLFVTDLSEVQEKAFRLADNKTAELAKWDDALLLEELNDLSIFDIDMADFGFDISDAAKRQKSWARTEKYCDLKKKIKANSCGDIIVASLYEVGKKGIPITDIKENPDNVTLFADNLVDYLYHLYGDNLAKGNWCIVTTPRRRHKDGFHFSTEISRAAAQMLNLPFYQDAFTAKNRARIDPEFYMEINPAETNVIVYDDIISTGETMRTVRRLLIDAGHVVFCVVGIRNVTMQKKS